MTFSFRQIALATFMLASLNCTPAFALFDDDEARRAILDLRNQIYRLEKRLERVESSTQGQLNLAQSINEKDQQIATLRGDLEVAMNSIRRLQDDNRTLYTNLDNRLKAVEPKKVELDGEKLQMPPEQYADYQAALNHFKAGNYEDASNQFSQFLLKYNKSSLEPQVRYFLGSSQFAKGDYKTALVIQRDLVRDYPTNPRAPDALLSIASCQIELRALPNAKKTLTELITKYPESPAAASAKTRLAALK